MKNKFIKYNFKSMLIPGLVVLGVMIIAAIISGLSSNIYSVVGNSTGPIDENNSFVYASGGLTGLITASTISSTVLGLIVFTYRFSLKKVDIFYQAPYKEKNTKIIRTLIGMFYIAIAFTTAFLILILLYSSRLIGKVEVYEYQYSADMYYRLATMNPIVYLASYFIGLSACIACYLFAVLFSSCTNSLTNSIIITLEGFFTLNLVGFMIFSMLSFIDAIPNDTYLELSGLGQMQVSQFFYDHLDKLSVGVIPYMGTSHYVLFYSTISLIGLIPLLIIAIFIQKEPSGEKAGKGGYVNNFGRFYHHITMGALNSYLMLLYEPSVFPLFFGYLIFVPAYYLITAWINKSFKFTSKDLIPFVVNIAASIALTIVFISIKVNKSSSDIVLY